MFRNLPWRVISRLRPMRPVQKPWDGVPKAFHDLPPGSLEIPASLDQWTAERERIKSIVMRCLGDLPPRPETVQVTILWRKAADGYSIEKFTFHNGVDSAVPGYIAIPDRRTGRCPAILAIHGHGGSKEVIFGMTPSQQEVAGRLARKGYVVLAIDNYFSGERVAIGPGGAARWWDRPGSEEMSLFKLNLWLGRSLWGMMLRDQQMALDYLASRPEVDPECLGAQGMSMGSTAAWWLAALDDRIRAVVGVACFTRYHELIATRGLREHSIYYFVPGILRRFDTEAIMGLIAPRPFLALTGDRDPGSPPEGIQALERVLNRIYGLYGRPDCFRSLVYPNTGHVYSEDMKNRMMEWFGRFL